MDIIKGIVAFFQKPEEETAGTAPEGMCPMCWGYQEYDGKIRELFWDKQIDVNNHKSSYTFIRDFVKEYIEGYHIKDGIVHVCPDCKELEEGKDRVEKYTLTDEEE